MQPCRERPRSLRIQPCRWRPRNSRIQLQPLRGQPRPWIQPCCGRPRCSWIQPCHRRPRNPRIAAQELGCPTKSSRIPWAAQEFEDPTLPQAAQNNPRARGAGQQGPTRNKKTGQGTSGVQRGWANKDQQPRNARTRNWACKRGEPTRAHRRGTQGLGTWNAQDQQARNPRSRKFGRQKAAGHQGPTTAEPQAKESRAGKGSGPTFCAAGAKDSADLRTDMAPLGPCMDRPAWILASSTPEGTDPELWMQANRS